LAICVSSDAGKRERNIAVIEGQVLRQLLIRELPIRISETDAACG
jgi:hypothetical protein